MSNVTSAVKAFMDDENGVTAIEYGLIASLIGVAIVTAVGGVGDQLKLMFNYVVTQLSAGSTK